MRPKLQAREAIERVRRKRPGSIETAEQETVVEDFERMRREKHARSTNSHTS
ncbi:MAG TPA: hypothetical protein VKV20_10900 [Ktedonobacteraceae bacterium]|nr:hypothetical protein [Ktedonobacteraceae bacterium]